jgi:hypothetical protein
MRHKETVGEGRVSRELVVVLEVEDDHGRRDGEMDDGGDRFGARHAPCVVPCHQERRRPKQEPKHQSVDETEGGNQREDPRARVANPSRDGLFQVDRNAGKNKAWDANYNDLVAEKQIAPLHWSKDQCYGRAPDQEQRPRQLQIGGQGSANQSNKENARQKSNRPIDGVEHVLVPAPMISDNCG